MDSKPQRLPISNFIARENISRYRELLSRRLEEPERRRILGLLQEEEAKLAKFERKPFRSAHPDVVD